MPKFDASAFEDCEYDFTGIRSAIDQTYIQDKGVVPEPSRHLVSATMGRIADAFNTVKPPSEGEDEVDATPEAITEAMERLSDAEEFEKMAEALLDVVSDFCKGHPSKESLDALPWPRFMGFFGYIMENMLSPEASAPNEKPRRLRSV